MVKPPKITLILEHIDDHVAICQRVGYLVLQLLSNHKRLLNAFQQDD